MERPEWSTLQQSKILKGHMVNFKSINNPVWVSDQEAPTLPTLSGRKQEKH